MVMETSIIDVNSVLRYMRRAAYHGTGKLVTIWESEFWVLLSRTAELHNTRLHLFLSEVMAHPHFEAVRVELECVLGGDTFRGLNCDDETEFYRTLRSPSPITSNSGGRGLYE